MIYIFIKFTWIAIAMTSFILVICLPNAYNKILGWFFWYNLQWKTWKHWGCSLVSCIETCGLCGSFWRGLGQAFQIELIDTSKCTNQEKKVVNVFGANWCMNKPWTCKAHYNLDLGGVTNLLLIIHSTFPHRGYIEMTLFLKLSNKSLRMVKL
jgi:hypothetical protein